ncbi:MAG: adenylate/guanylate cyclase domain-containing protein [Paracoccaceae bacterium]|nr:adenylate/guanylate cyclase domain-containing protein [Paracoccaceae bacterium]
MRRHTLLLLALGAGLAAGLAALRLADPVPLRDLRLAYFDTLQRLDPRPYTPVPVRVVDIDEAALRAFGQWPWPRDLMVELADRLAGAGAAVVVYDILFAEPDRGSSPEADAAFASAVARGPSVLGTARTDGRETDPPPVKAGIVAVGRNPATGLPRAPGLTPVLPDLAAAASGVGVISVGSDGAGPVRRLPLAWSGPAGPIPALSVEALRTALGETTLTLFGSDDLDGVIEGIGLGDLFVPTAFNGELWLRYRRDDPGLYLAAGEVLSAPPAAWGAQVEGHIVLVGTSAAGLLDIRTTALGEAVPGVSIHAQAIEQMLLGTHLSRSDVTAGAEVLAFLALAALLTLAVAFTGPTVAIGLGSLGAACLLAASWLAFTRGGILFDAAFPLLAAGLTFALLAACRLIAIDRERRLIRRSFSHYVAPAVLSEIERRGHRIALGGEAREVTVLFSDIRGFTTLSERLPPEELVALLNRLFDAFGAEILAERGTIDKYIGDAVMAFWNAPLLVPDHPARAVAAALGMRAALARLNADRGGPPLRTALGIATGPASVGNIGSRNRFNYSVIGETVNLAARVEEACRPVGADILVTAPVAQAVHGHSLLDAGRIALKGMTGRVQVYAVAGDARLSADPRFGELTACHEDLIGALATGRPPASGRLAEARDLAEALHPGLGDFFDRLPHREGDYRSRALPTTEAPKSDRPPTAGPERPPPRV